MSTIDWSLGNYERTAAELEPVSARVVEQAGIGPGDRVLDIACGTGNAALKAAKLGADVVGVDLAERLVLVARQRAQAAGLTARFVPADAQQLPLEDAAIDVALSVFGLIFAPDQGRAAAELVRVLAPGGRGIVTAWVPDGALAAVNRAMVAALAEVSGAASPPAGSTQPVRWGEEAVVRELFAAHDVDIAHEGATIPFLAVSPDAWAADQAEHHPLWLSARAMLGDERFALLQRELVTILHEANEDPAGFRITSRYVIVTISRR